MKKSKIVILVVIVASLIIGIGVFVNYKSGLDAVQSNSEVVMFNVADGETLSTITKNLEEQGIIKSSSSANFNAKLSGNSQFQAGGYMIDKAWSASQILEYISNPDNIDNQHVVLTFREGIWAKQIATFLGQYLNVSTDELLTLWSDETYIRTLMKDYKFLSEDVLTQGTRVKLEGYLFPDTYQFDKDANADTITRIFLNRFQEIYNRNDGFKNSELSIHEIVKLASIIQMETGVGDEMGLVSSVFHNRLQIDMPLGSSVTKCYALYDYENPKECETGIIVDDIYDTYGFSGLPIGPISNPGEKALIAASKPEKSEYLYFIGDVCGSGKTIFATTLEEHNKNIKEKLTPCGW